MSKKKSATQGKPWAGGSASKATKQTFGKSTVLVRRPPRHQGR